MAITNVFIISGNLTAKPELKQTQNGKTCTTFTVAHNYKYANEDKTDFFSVVVFGKLAENCVNYLGKGSKAIVTGECHIDKWKGKDGVERERVKVQASDVEFLTKPTATSPSYAGPSAYAPVPAPAEDDSPF